MRGVLRGSVFHNTLWHVKLHKCRTSDGPSHQSDKKEKSHPPPSKELKRSKSKKTNPVEEKSSKINGHVRGDRGPGPGPTHKESVR